VAGIRTICIFVIISTTLLGLGRVSSTGMQVVVALLPALPLAFKMAQLFEMRIEEIFQPTAQDLA
jgi:hypothetical protein